MNQIEYRLHYHGIDEVMESTRYTIADNDEQAIEHFKLIAPTEDGREWFYLERYCPYAEKWYTVKQYTINPTIHTHG